MAIWSVVTEYCLWQMDSIFRDNFMMTMQKEKESIIGWMVKKYKANGIKISCLNDIYHWSSLNMQHLHLDVPTEVDIFSHLFALINSSAKMEGEQFSKREQKKIAHYLKMIERTEQDDVK